MASAAEQQCFLKWNNFKTDFSADFHELLFHDDLTDVTLAVEDQLVMAHRLVVCMLAIFQKDVRTDAAKSKYIR